MDPKQSLDLIRTMIDKARFNFSRGSFYFILWGGLLIAAGLFEFFMLRTGGGELAYLGWPVVGISGGIASFVYGARTSKVDPVTHLDRVYSGIWVTYFITLFILIISMVNQQHNPGSYIMILTGLPTVLTGYVLRFKPLLIGGIVFWVLGVGSLFMPVEYRPLVFCFCILVGYLIPGLMMKYSQPKHV